MKNLYQYTCVILLVLAASLVSCEENDPFEELGEVVSGKVPFITTSGIQNLYAADDSILFNVYYWSAEDDIAKLALGKGEQVSIVGNITVDDGGGPTTVEIASLLENEIMQEGADITHDPLDYETARNAYNKPMIFHIGPQYQLLELESPDQIEGLDNVVYSQEIKSLIIQALEENGVLISSWAELEGMTTAIELVLESTLSFQVQVFDAEGESNYSSVTTVKVGAIN